MTQPTTTQQQQQQQTKVIVENETPKILFGGVSLDKAMTASLVPKRKIVVNDTHI